MPLISYFPSAGGGEEPGYSSWFGTGEDGDLTVTEDTPLDVILDEGQIIKQYNNLTITETGVLHPANRCNGMVLLVKGDLTVDGTIHVNKCAPLLNPNEDMAVQEQHIALCGAHTGGNAGNAGNASGGDAYRKGSPGVGGTGFALGGGYGAGSAGVGTGSGNSAPGANYTVYDGGDGDPRPPLGTSMPYPSANRADASYGAGGYSYYSSRAQAYGGSGPGGSGAIAGYNFITDRNISVTGVNGEAYGGGLLCIFVQGKVRINGVISSDGGDGALGNSFNSAFVGGGGGGGGGIVLLVHTGDFVNAGSVRANGGKAGAGGAGDATDGSIGTVFIKNISELLTV